MIRLDITRTIDRTELVKSILKDSIKQVITKSCEDVVALAKTRVPVDTGNLKNSIEADLSKINDLEATVGSNVDYSLYVEMGTHNMPAKPYMTNSFEEVAAQFQAVVQRVIDARMRSLG